MANLNKVMLIGRLTRDPEVRTFANGGKVAKLGFAVNNRRKNATTGQWEDDPVFLDMEVFNRGENGRQADLVEQSLRKGQQVFIEGHLRMDNWTSQDGQKRSKLVVVVDNFQFLEPRGEGSPAPLSANATRTPVRGSAAPPRSQGFSPEPDHYAEGPMDEPEGPADDIPF